MTKEGTSKSLAERIVSASLVVGFAHLCFKVLGIVQVTFAAKHLPKEQYESILVFAFEGVIMTFFFLGEESIGPTFLPVFLKEKDKLGEKAAWEFANIVLTLQLIFLLSVTLVIVCYPTEIVETFTQWRMADKPKVYSLAAEALVWLAPCTIFLSLGSTTYMLLNGYKRFFLAAFGDASWKICVVVSLIIGVGMLDLGYRGLFWGLVVGSIAKLLTHLAGLLKELRYVRPSINFKSPAFKAMLILMLPLLIGIIFAKTRDFVNNVYVLSTIKESGVMQANSLGRKLFTAINMLVPFAISIAMFPFFCELVDRKDLKKMGEVLTDSSRMLLACLMPAVIVLAVLAESMAILLFLRGKMEVGIALWTGMATACYLVVVPAAAVECIMMQGYFANRKMISVSLIGIFCSTLSIAISYYLIVVQHAGPVAGLIIVSLGFAFSRYLKSFLLVFILRRSVPMFPLGQTLGFSARLLLLVAVVGAATWGVRSVSGRILNDGLSEAKHEMEILVNTPERALSEKEIKQKIKKMKVVVASAISGLAGVFVFFLASWLLRLKEPFDMWLWGQELIRNKLKKRRAG